MRNFLKKINFDIYHSFFYSNSLEKNFQNKISITTVHDLMYLLVPNFFSQNNIINYLKKSYINFIVKTSLKNSNYIISVSDATKNDLFQNLNFESFKVPEGINKLAGKNENVLKINNLKKNDYFLYVGNSRPHKNLEFLISAYLKSKTNKKLVLCGTLDKIRKIENKNIYYLDFVKDEELKSLYENCAAFIFPSKYEGFGLPILEALSNGAKVFTSNGGALKEFPKEVIYYFDPYKEVELINFLENENNYKLKKDEVNKILENYSWGIVEKNMNKFFDSILGEKNGKGN
jgi:glycosyltransferase involved in cell wall biosynthesis